MISIKLRRLSPAFECVFAKLCKFVNAETLRTHKHIYSDDDFLTFSSDNQTDIFISLNINASFSHINVICVVFHHAVAFSLSLSLSLSLCCFICSSVRVKIYGKK